MYRLYNTCTGYIIQVPVISYRYRLYHTCTSYSVILKQLLTETKKILRHAVESNLYMYIFNGKNKILILSKFTFTILTLECVFPQYFTNLHLFYMVLH